jgi:hypothetical protein
MGQTILGSTSGKGKMFLLSKTLTLDLGPAQPIQRVSVFILQVN